MSQAYVLRAGPYQDGELEVVRFRGREALSRPFQFDLDLCAAYDEPVDVRPLLGRDALLVVRSPGGERLVHGIVSRVEELGLVRLRHRYRLRLVPRLARLALTRRSRQFHGKTAPEIVKEVLAAGKVALRAALKASYPARELCVQYRESDLAFVSRLLESEGITYFFEHGEDEHTLVLADAPDSHPAVDGTATLPFRERGAAADGDHVYALEPAGALRADAVSLGDFDFVRPAVPLAGSAGDGGLEDHDPDGELATAAAGKQLARVRLEGHVARASLVAGESVCVRLAPGMTFELDEHPAEAHNRAYLVVEVDHRGDEPEHNELAGDDTPYDNVFRCQPADLPFRPALRTPRPTVPGVQTARVVGPAGEEIHTDEHGRVKVQFHWDREGLASTWVRVSQAWAGAGWGALYLPRIGMEVVLRFLGGNPDRPLVVGATYNGENPPPVALPAEKTKSVLRSASSLGSGGHNELTFEDAAGSEQIYLHAQKDEAIVVENDKNQSVVGFDSLAVRKDRSRDVTGKQALHVGIDDVAQVDGSQRLTVMLSRTVNVTVDHGEDIGKHARETIGLFKNQTVTLASTENVGLAKAINIGGAYLVDVLAAESIAVGGLLSRNVGGFAKETVAGSSAENVGGDRTSKVVVGSLSVIVDADHSRSVGKSSTVDVGQCLLTAAVKPASMQAKKIQITADELGLTMNGEICLIINKSGTLKIFAKNLLLEGSSKATFKGKKIKLGGSGSGAKKKGKDVLDGEQATKGPKGKGGNELLSPDDAKGFEGMEYEARVLKKDLVAYRLHDGGGGAYPLGKWVSKAKHPPGLEGKLRTALDPTWGNGATKVAKIHLPAGTKVFEGPIAAQGGGAYASTGSQLCVAVPKALRGAEIGKYLNTIGVKVLP